MPPTQISLEGFDCAAIPKKEVYLPPVYPVWTKHKANVIRLYLFYFMMITRHGTYIDGFAGPQNIKRPEAWSAKLAIENEPPWFRRFFLFEQKKDKVELLNALKEAQPQNVSREIEVFCGDFNMLVHDFLKRNPIGDKEATFCLLDQRTFECNWSTVTALANHKKNGYKIELFYFLPISWLDRAISGLKSEEALKIWWGRDDFEILKGQKPVNRALIFKERFEEEFGYKHVKPWPFYSRRGGGRIMYYMVHASDHAEAPKLMHRAYCEVVRMVPKDGKGCQKEFCFEF